MKSIVAPIAVLGTVAVLADPVGGAGEWEFTGEAPDQQLTVLSGECTIDEAIDGCSQVYILEGAKLTLNVDEPFISQPELHNFGTLELNGYSISVRRFDNTIESSAIRGKLPMVVNSSEEPVSLRVTGGASSCYYTDPFARTLAG
ncbi:MAG TPA: hypothetical protein P5026_04680 [Kiritimatiellia bacterium]|nr:hypothetical protein [Kiritimatiellia bacterium]HRU69482.1 hypothetical protein [Kiritimatiellia bacterium]